MKKSKKYIVSFILAVICGVMFSVSVSAYEIWHQGLKTIPCDVYIASGTTTNQRDRINDAMQTWNDGCFGYDCLVYDGVIAMTQYDVDDDINCVTRLTNSSSTAPATTYIVNKYYRFLSLKWYVVEFDINFNANYTWYAGLSTCPYDELDIESAALHEFGHVLGLDHITNRYYNGVREPMYYEMAYGEMFRDLTTYDIDEIHYLY